MSKRIQTAWVENIFCRAEIHRVLILQRIARIWDLWQWVNKMLWFFFFKYSEIWIICYELLQLYWTSANYLVVVMYIVSHISHIDRHICAEQIAARDFIFIFRLFPFCSRKIARWNNIFAVFVSVIVMIDDRQLLNIVRILIEPVSVDASHYRVPK